MSWTLFLRPALLTIRCQVLAYFPCFPSSNTQTGEKRRSPSTSIMHQPTQPSKPTFENQERTSSLGASTIPLPPVQPTQPSEPTLPGSSIILTPIQPTQPSEPTFHNQNRASSLGSTLYLDEYNQKLEDYHSGKLSKEDLDAWIMGQDTPHSDAIHEPETGVCCNCEVVAKFDDKTCVICWHPMCPSCWLAVDIETVRQELHYSLTGDQAREIINRIPNIIEDKRFTAMFMQENINAVLDKFRKLAEENNWKVGDESMKEVDSLQERVKQMMALNMVFKYPLPTAVCPKARFPSPVTVEIRHVLNHSGQLVANISLRSIEETGCASALKGCLTSNVLSKVKTNRRYATFNILFIAEPGQYRFRITLKETSSDGIRTLEYIDSEIINVS